MFNTNSVQHEQDLVQVLNSDQPYWLNGLTEMPKIFGLQLLESILVKFPSIFCKVRKTVRAFTH